MWIVDQMRNDEVEKNIKTLSDKIDKIESSLNRMADVVADSHKVTQMTGLGVASLNFRIEALGSVLNAQEFSQEVRTGMGHMLQIAAFSTSLSFAVYGIGLALPNSHMQMLGTLGLFPSMLFMAVYFFQVRRHEKVFLRQIQNLADNMQRKSKSTWPLNGNEKCK